MLCISFQYLINEILAFCERIYTTKVKRDTKVLEVFLCVSSCPSWQISYSSGSSGLGDEDLAGGVGLAGIDGQEESDITALAFHAFRGSPGSSGVVPVSGRGTGRPRCARVVVPVPARGVVVPVPAKQSRFLRGSPGSRTGLRWFTDKAVSESICDSIIATIAKFYIRYKQKLWGFHKLGVWGVGGGYRQTKMGASPWMLPSLVVTDRGLAKCPLGEPRTNCL